MKRFRGFSLVELMVVVALVSILVVIVVPFLGNVISNARARSVVSKFTQDFAALRNVASTGIHAPGAVTLTVNADCSWASSVDGAGVTARSMTSAVLTGTVSGMACTGPTFPATFTFTSQGFVAPAATVTFSRSGTQTWPLQVLPSGTIANTTGGR